jgi:hypothetical protein
MFTLWSCESIGYGNIWMTGKLRGHAQADSCEKLSYATLS